MAAETRKLYIGNLSGEGNYLFVVPMTDSEMSTISEVFNRIKCLDDESYSPVLSICTKPYKKEEIDDVYYSECRHFGFYDLFSNNGEDTKYIGIGSEDEYDYTCFKDEEDE